MDKYEILVNSDAIYLDASALAKIDKDEGDSSRLIRILVYGSALKFFCSWIAFGEVVGVFGKKKVQKRIGLENYLYCCRSLMKDFEINKINRVEPPEDRYQFIRLATKMISRYAKLGGADIWHLMAALELKHLFPATSLFSYDKKLVNAASLENVSAVYGTNLIPERLVEKLKKYNKWIA